MNSNDETLCLEELDHLILDGDKKINLQYISNTWNVPWKISESILQKWLENYKGEKKVAKEFLIRGIDKNNRGVITVVPESKLAKVDEICPGATKMLYSIETASLNGRTLNLPERSEKRFISLKLDIVKPDVKVQKAVVPPPVKKEPEPVKKTATNNLFGAAKSKQPENKQEKISPTKVAQQNNTKTSPKDKSPKKNQSMAKPAQAKSIANFFNSKPSASSASTAQNKNSSDKSITEATIKIEKVEIKDEPETWNESENNSKNSNKRNLSNMSDSNDEASSNKKTKTSKVEPSKKKMKLEPKSTKSRIMQICDSSSDEDESKKNDPQPMSEDEDEKLKIKKEKENKTPSPGKNGNANSNVDNNNSSGKRRIKMKKMVTRTYEDEDGFINTVREMEEVSCSDEEPEPVSVEASTKKTATASNTSTTTTTTTTTNNKKKISPPVSKKQGSILNFFTKK